MEKNEVTSLTGVERLRWFAKIQRCLEYALAMKHDGKRLFDGQATYSHLYSLSMTFDIPPLNFMDLIDSLQV